MKDLEIKVDQLKKELGKLELPTSGKNGETSGTFQKNRDQTRRKFKEPSRNF